MSQFRITPLDESLVRRVRASLQDPIYGRPLSVEPATGYGPCRLCLRTFAPGEPRILFLFNAFSPTQEADLAGPVFIHAEHCTPYGESSLFPEALASLPIVFRAYDADRRCLFEVSPKTGGEAAALETLLASPSVAVVHIRNAEAKCFIARVERTQTAVQPEQHIFLKTR